MDNAIILRGEVQRAFAIRFLTNLKIDPVKPMVVRIEPHKKTRTHGQLALLWMRHAQVAKAVAEHTGYSAEEIHDYLKERFLTPKIVEINGAVVRRYSTKNLTAAEMSDFMAKIEAWAVSELGLMLISPEDREYA